MSLTKPIPSEIRADLAEDPFMRYCCLQGNYFQCTGRIEWHHHLKFAGKRVNERWCILPLCKWHHDHEAEFKKYLNNIMVARATEDELRPYSKAIDYVDMKRRL